jgi:hypothetical protein
LKQIEKKMQFKLKEILMLRANKDELEKKFISALEQNRKVEGEMYDLRREKRVLEGEVRTLNDSLA